MDRPHISRTPVWTALRFAVPASGALLAAKAGAQTVFAVNQTAVAATPLLYIDVDGGSATFGDPTNAELRISFLSNGASKPQVGALTGNAHEAYVNDGNWVANLPFGTVIDSTLMATDDNTTFDVALNISGRNDVNWAAGTQGYIGFNFDSDGTTYYGYADLTYTADQHIYVGNVGYAPGSITAGAPAVPEPATYAALAGLVAGSAALLIRRRQRKAALA